MNNRTVLSWWCLAVLDYVCIIFNCTSFSISPQCYLFPYSKLAKLVKLVSSALTFVKDLGL